MSKCPYTHLIWDFNGTILDDIDLGIHCVNVMLSKRDLPIIRGREHYRSIMSFPIIDYYARLGFDFEKEDYYTVLAPEWVDLYMAGEGECLMMSEVLETLQAVKNLGIPQIVLSASNRDQLLFQLRRLGVDTYFDEILGLDNIYAKSKTHLASVWLSQNPTAVPLCIGDTDHDAALADVMGADCVLYTGGHQSREKLAPCNKPMIDHIGQVLDFLR